MKRLNAKNIHVHPPKAFVFGGIFIIALVASVFVFRHLSFADVSNSITMNSQGASFENHEEGAWKITKTATLTGDGKAEVKFNAESILKGDQTNKDILVMLDTSGSMTQDRIAQVKGGITTLATTLLADGNNRIALGNFSTTAQMITPDFTDNAGGFRFTVYEDIPPVGGGTNYYAAFHTLGEFFESYTQRANTTTIVIFLTDGAPFEDHPLEESEYLDFKTRFPFVKIHGLQYELGEEVIPGIAKVSDEQFVSNMSNFEDVLFEAAQDGKKYSRFELADQINSEYFEIESVSQTKGEATIDDTGENPYVFWNMNNQYRSGTQQSLTIKLNIKDACLQKEDGLCETNLSTNLKTKIDDSEEYIEAATSPVVKVRYTVTYDTNAPEGCTPTGNYPEPSRELVYRTIEISDTIPVCNGYKFHGWALTADNVQRFNDNYFAMPESDLTIRAIWSAPSISKSMDGTIKQMTSAEFETGNGVRERLSWAGAYSTTKLKNADSLPLDFTPSHHNTLSSSTSELPIYFWVDGDNSTTWIYTDADVMYFNADSARFFESWRPSTPLDLTEFDNYDVTHIRNMDRFFADAWISPESMAVVGKWDVSNVESMGSIFYKYGSGSASLDGLEDWDISNVKSLSYAFAESRINDLSALEKWNTSNVEALQYAFNNSIATDISALADWDVKKAKNMEGIFFGSAAASYAPLLGWETDSLEGSLAYAFASTAATSISGLDNFDISRVNSMDHTFSGAKFTDTTPLFEWDTSSVTDMSSIFDHSKIVNTAGLADWETGAVESLYRAFLYTGNPDLTGLTNWDVTAVTNLESTFEHTGLTSLHGLEKWKPRSATTMKWTFAYDYSLTSITPLADWDVSSVSNFYRTFRLTPITSLTPLKKWQVGSATYLYATFNGTNITSANGLEDWDVSKVYDMTDLFSECEHLNDISDLSGWQTIALTTLSGTFASTAITTAHGLEGWDVSKVTSLNATFKDTSLTTTQALSSWNVAAVSDMSYTFAGCSSLTSLSGSTHPSGLDGWVTTSLTTLAAFVGKANNLTDISALGYSGWTTAKVTSLQETFASTAISDFTPIAGWDVSKVTTMYAMMEYNTQVSSLAPLASWQTNSLKNIGFIFDGCTSLISTNGLGSWETTGFTNARAAFRNNYALEDVSDLANWQSATNTVGNISDMNSMFAHDAAVTDWSPLDGWNAESAGKGDMFTGATAPYPLWY